MRKYAHIIVKRPSEDYLVELKDGEDAEDAISLIYDEIFFDYDGIYLKELLDDDQGVDFDFFDQDKIFLDN